MNAVPMEKTLAFAENLAQKAGNLLTSFFKLDGSDTELKSDRSVVTEADLVADALIRGEIQSAYPEDLILTEETNQISLIADRPLWIVDPLDGTTNFSLGLHTWGVSIARLLSGYPNTAALFFPQYSELYSAQRGGGAFLNHQPLKKSAKQKNHPTAFFACCSRTLRHYDIHLRYKTRILGSAAYDFCSVARGAAIAAFQSTTKIWDIAAGWLVLEEAGGMVELYGGGSPFPYLPDGNYTNKIYPTMMAANQVVAEKLRRSIVKKPVT